MFQWLNELSIDKVSSILGVFTVIVTVLGGLVTFLITRSSKHMAKTIRENKQVEAEIDDRIKQYLKNNTMPSEQFSFEAAVDDRIKQYLKNNTMPSEQFSSALEEAFSERFNLGKLRWDDQQLNDYLQEPLHSKDKLQFTVFYLNYKQMTSDAHLSRMICYFLLVEKKYLWSLGWAGRSLKRYGTIQPQQVTIEKKFKYGDFIEDITEYVVAAIEGIVEAIELGADKKVEEMFKKNGAISRETIRFYKDISDFLQKEFCSELMGNRHPIMLSILHTFIKVLVRKNFLDEHDLEMLRLYVAKISWFQTSDLRFIGKIEKEIDKKDSFVSEAERQAYYEKSLGELKIAIERFKTI